MSTFQSAADPNMRFAQWLSAINRGKYAMVDYLKEHGLDYHGQDGQGVLSWILRQKFSKGKTAEMLEAAIALGISPSGPPGAAVTPLHNALLAKDNDAAALLLGHGADPNNGGSLVIPLEVVLGSVRWEHDDAKSMAQINEAVSLLLAAGADPNRRPRSSGEHLMDSLISNLSEIERNAAIKKLFHQLWQNGASWQTRWDEDILDAPAWKELGHQARLESAKKEEADLDSATPQARATSRPFRL